MKAFPDMKSTFRPFIVTLCAALIGTVSAYTQSLDEARELTRKGIELHAKGRYSEALPLFEQSLAIWEKTLGPQHPNTATSLHNLASLYQAMGDNAKALPLFERSLAIREQTLGPQHPETATSLNNLALLYQAMGDNAKALPLFERSLAIREQTLGPQQGETAISLNNLAVLYQAMGDNAKALPLFERSLAITEKILGPQHPNTATSLNNLADLYRAMGDYAKALLLFERSLAIREQTLGPQHPETATSLHNLAFLYQQRGDNAKALPLFERALAIQEKALGPQHPNTASSLSNLANLYLAMGDNAKALPLFERALAIREKALGPQHSETLSSLEDLAHLYRAMGDNAKSLPLIERSLAITEKTLGPQHPETATSLNNLAVLYLAMGDNAKALPLFERSLAIKEKILGPQHPKTATSLNNLARLYLAMGDYAKALPLFERSLAIWEKTLGPQHPNTAASLHNLALLYQAMGDNAKALPLLERSLAIKEKTLGPQHPDTAKSLHTLAVLYQKMGDNANARAFASRRVSSTHHQLQGILSMDERSRLSWQSEYLGYSIEPSVLRPEQMGQLVLRWKGIVLDSLIEDRAMASAVSSDSEGRQKLADIQQLRASMSKLAFSDKQADRDQSEQIANRIADLERSLASRTTILGRVRQSADITLDAVLPALADGSVLLDFFQYQDPKLKGKEARCYGALLLAEDGEPKIVRIEGEETIDKAIAAYRSAIGKGDEPALESSLKTLAEKLWHPIVAQLPPATKKLIIGPDGALNFLSFATLPDGNSQFLAEKYEIAYVGTGRDLAKPTTKRQNKNLEVFANPVFDKSVSQPTTNRLVMRAAEVTAFSEVRLPQLPGTEVEGATLSETAKKAGWAASVHFGPDATEQQIRAIKKPGILHLATHGFYLNTMASTGDGTRGMKVAGFDDDRPRPGNANGIDPMRASGIALSGAQATLKAWSDGKAPDPQNDGILTAEEVAGLDLHGTWLVTLSACETGVGEAKSGEGVFGLRRAFMMAGTPNLLMTLWPVSDKTTADIMAEFYRRALASGDAPGSLWETQRDWLVKLRKEKGVLAAVRDAGPFVMTTTGLRPTRPFEEKASTDRPDKLNRVDPEVAPRNNSEATSPSSPNAAKASRKPSKQANESRILSFEEVTEKANAGDSYAQAILSIYYGLGYKAEKDVDKSASLAMASAKQGHPLGIYRLGVMRQAGDGMQKSEDQGRKLKSQSIDGLNKMEGDPYALTALGVMLYRGEVVGENKPEAARLYKIAADQGYAPAQYNYAVCLDRGFGVNQDSELARSYLDIAAAQFYAPALEGMPK